MKTTVKTVSSFMRQWTAFVKGDDDKALGEKNYRKAKAALQAQIHATQGQIVSLEIKLEEANARVENSIINFGKLIEDDYAYVQQLIDAEDAAKKAEKVLKEKQAYIDFLERKLSELD
jgi:hypothetical protein